MAWYSLLKKNKEVSVNERPSSNNANTSLKFNEKKIKDFMIKAIGNLITQSNDREKFERPEYNLLEIKEASESDSYIKISLSKYSYLIYKAGASLKGEDARVEYLEKRFRLMSFATQKPMNILFQEVADDLFKFSNAFLIKKRVDSVPGIKATPALSNKIVGGYFRVDPASVKIKRDKNGNILKYEQGYGDNKKQFYPVDVIHIYMDKDANNAFGTPRIIAALEDVRLLRKIEGNISALIYRFSMPLYQWIVGLPQTGMQATDPEIAKAKREIEMSTLDGIVVTNERTEIKAVGAEGNALSAEGYLRYFEDRVFSALGVSASQMGRGGAKQDSESMEAQIHDTVKYVQRILSINIQEKILNELLLEGGYNPIFNEEDIVTYEFEEISLETKVKKENHEILKYQSNVTTFEESRRTMGMKDSVSDESRLYKNMIETNARLAEIDRTAEHQKDLAITNSKLNKDTNTNSNSSSSVSSSNKSPRSSKNTNANKAVTNNNRPQNQHGTHSAKIKEGHDIDNDHEQKFKNIFKIYKEASNDIENGEDEDLLLPLIANDISNQIKNEINKYSTKAISDAMKDIRANKNNKALFPDRAIVLNEFYEEVDKDVRKIMKDVSKQLKLSNNDIEAFEKNEYRIKFLIDYIIRKAYWYSYVKTGALIGIKEAYIIFNSEKDAKDREEVIDLKSFSIEDIPAYHSFCNCIVTYKKKKAGEK